jgi:assimilatory nitrate reductase catalytic subunit
VTVPAFDPVSKQPELKHAAIGVEKLSLPWQLVAIRLAPDKNAVDMMSRLQPMLARFEYATVGLYGRDEPAVVLRVAHNEPVQGSVLEELDALLEFDDACTLSYADARRGISKRVMVQGSRVTAARLTGETAARDWLKEAITDGTSAELVRRWVLAPVATVPAGLTPRGRIVCTCENVAQSDIAALVAQGAGLDALKAELRCGTGCGSCLPELNRLLESHAKAAA